MGEARAQQNRASHPWRGEGYGGRDGGRLALVRAVSGVVPRFSAGVPEEAVLVHDTAATVRTPGSRSVGSEERRVLFTASRAQIEIQLAAPSKGEDDPSGLFGQYVPLGPDGPGGPRRVRVVLYGSGGRAAVTISTPNGEFVLDCDPERPFWLEFTAGDGPPIRARVDPAS